MANCKCKSKPRIVSSVVNSMDSRCCKDVCTTPICGEPDKLSIMAPVIYDEIGINLCTTFPANVDIATTYPTATSATARIINATYSYGEGNVEITPIVGRTNCYDITLSNITLLFEVRLYDSACRLVATIFPTAVYLPSETSAETYDEDTNPTSVELELFAPYGISYNTAGTSPTPVINYIGFALGANTITQGINFYSRAKLINLDISSSTLTVGVTLILQSVYFAGYKVDNCGKIDTPKGCIITPENSDCMRFVSGELLELEIKPLDLGYPSNEQCLKKNCSVPCGSCMKDSCMKDNCKIGCSCYNKENCDNNCDSTCNKFLENDIFDE